MIRRLYVERELLGHHRAQGIIARSGLRPIACEHYGEILNPVRQDFRLQKRAQALILAARRGKRVHPAQQGYAITADAPHYYFSHLLNCPYDCSYCFLQGRYNSAHMALFINYEDFAADIARLCEGGDRPCFLSGYDSDSLALEPLSGFAQYLIPLFRELPATLELRTKSLQTRMLRKLEPCPNVVLAFSISPEQTRQAMEPGVPSREEQLRAMRRLGEMGWPLGLRFEPVIDHGDTMGSYRELFSTIFRQIKPEWVHSATVSPLHMPNSYFQRAARRNPEVALYAQPLPSANGIRSYPAPLQQSMLAGIERMLSERMPRRLIHCYRPGQAAA